MSERLEILERVEAGEISVEEGARLLEGTGAEAWPSQLRPAWADTLWQVTLTMGVVVLAGAGFLLADSYTAEGPMMAMFWKWLLFAGGVLLVVLGWWLQRARWLHVRIREQAGRRITILMPLPLGLVTFGLRVAQPFVPDLKSVPVDEFARAVQQGLEEEGPFAVEINEGQGGDDVQIYFG